MNPNKKMWMVRAGKGGIYSGEFESENIVGIGWHMVGDMSHLNTYDKVRAAVELHYPGSPQKVGQHTGVLNKFRAEIKKDDLVITYDGESRVYLVGEVSGDYEYDSGAKVQGLTHRRRVEWQSLKISRDMLTDSVKNSLGGLATLFEIKEEHKDEILSQLSAKKKPAVLSDEDVDDEPVEPDAPDDLAEKAREAVKDKIAGMTPEKMEHLAAALFRAMGLVATVTQQKKDGGYDVYASPDGLMFEEPRIRAEVKHQKEKIGRPDMQKFIQAKGDSRGVFISTGGFNGDTLTEARNNEVITLDLSQLANMIVKHYDNFDGEGCALLPMKKLYIPFA